MAPRQPAASTSSPHVETRFAAVPNRRQVTRQARRVSACGKSDPRQPALLLAIRHLVGDDQGLPPAAGAHGADLSAKHCDARAVGARRTDCRRAGRLRRARLGHPGAAGAQACVAGPAATPAQCQRRVGGSSDRFSLWCLAPMPNPFERTWAKSQSVTSPRCLKAYPFIGRWGKSSRTPIAPKG